MTDNIIVAWMLIFFVLFFIYFDMRINSLKKELLLHYNIFEELLQECIKKTASSTSSTFSSTSKINKKFQILNPQVKDIVPSQEETRKGLEFIKNIRGIDWFNDNYAPINF